MLSGGGSSGILGGVHGGPGPMRIHCPSITGLHGVSPWDPWAHLWVHVYSQGSQETQERRRGEEWGEEGEEQEEEDEEEDEEEEEEGGGGGEGGEGRNNHHDVYYYLLKGISKK